MSSGRNTWTILMELIDQMNYIPDKFILDVNQSFYITSQFPLLLDFWVCLFVKGKIDLMGLLWVFDKAKLSVELSFENPNLHMFLTVISLLILVELIRKWISYFLWCLKSFWFERRGFCSWFLYQNIYLMNLRPVGRNTWNILMDLIALKNI